MNVREVGEAIKEDAEAILAAWRAITRKEPWLSLPEGADLNHLPEAIGALVDAALLDPCTEEDIRCLVESAATHGEQRRKDGFAEPVLLQEHHLLRCALGNYVEDLCRGSLVAFEARARLDITITLAATASLLGYHHAEVDARGEWPEAMEQLAREWRPPWGVEAR